MAPAMISLLVITPPSGRPTLAAASGRKRSRREDGPPPRQLPRAVSSPRSDARLLSVGGVRRFADAST
eukprot:7965424-Pyramimonas_sp.AAC.1